MLLTLPGFITGVDLSPYYTTAEANSLSSMLSGAIDYVSANAYNVEVTNVVQSNSAQWGQGGGGNPEVENYVTSNSGKIDTVCTAYQTNSGNYLKNNEFKPTIGRNLTGGTFGLAVGSYSKSFNYGLAIGEYANKYVPDNHARSNAAIGYSAHAYGTGSQAFGEQVVVSGGMAIGKCNKTSACSFVIGNGTSNTARSDIFVINYDGSVSAAGKISANGVELGGGGVTGEFVPQSAFDELKASYDALSSLFATYSGQWLLPNEGV